MQAHEDVVPASHLREAYAKIRDLERALGRKTMEVEILRAAQEVVKNEIERRGVSLWPTIVSLKSRLGSTRRAIGGNLATKRGSSSILEIVALPPASRALQ